jgi:hypothetical protein
LLGVDRNPIKKACPANVDDIRRTRNKGKLLSELFTKYVFDAV